MTPAVVRQAYVEALYHAHQGRWDYRRLTERWWTDLVAATAAAGNLTTVLTRHPLPVYPDALGGPFSRPLVPFSCRPPRRCGRGTHRTPARSCAIDPTVDFKTYNWLWQQGKQWPWHQTTEEKAKSIRDSLTKAFAERRKKKAQKS